VGAGGVTLVDPCGSARSLLREAESLGRLPDAVVDTAFHRDRISCGYDCAVGAEAVYWLPPSGVDRLDDRFHRRLGAPATIGGMRATPINGGCNVRLEGRGFSIAPDACATYHTCCAPDDRGSDAYDAVNRGTFLIDERRRWQLEFGPPGCLPH